jgi:prevent-host-death family protein
MESRIKGAVAEQAIALAATKLGVPVLRPTADGGRYDLALDIGKRLWRVQCKWGRLTGDACVVAVNIRGSYHSPGGYVQSTYAEDEIDLLGVYCGALDRCFLLPSSLIAGLSAIHLRLSPARNGQRACITLADDFDFDGAVAQLGERLAGSEEVRGSSPLSSTSTDDPPITVAANPLRDRFGYWMDRVEAGEQVVVTRHGRPRIRLLPMSALQATLPLPPENSEAV